MKVDQFKKTALIVSVINLALNAALAAFKLSAGFFSGSRALISDGANSAADMIGTLIVLIGVSLSSKKADKNHQFGHERFEPVAALLLCMILFFTAFFSGYSGVISLSDGSYKTLSSINVIAIIAASVSVVVKAAMFVFTYAAAKKTGYTSLKGDAFNFLSDVFLSISTLIAVVLSRFGMPIFDPIACIVIALLILWSCITIFKEAIGKMTDQAADSETVGKITAIILSTKNVICLDSLKTRVFGNRIYVELEICCDAEMTLKESHFVAEEVHDRLEADISEIKHCVVHVNPCTDGMVIIDTAEK